MQGLIPESSGSESEAGELEEVQAEAAEAAEPAGEGFLLSEAESETDTLLPGHSERASSSRDVAPAAPAQRSRRAFAWGVFRISPLFSQGHQIGWEASCNMHQNTGDCVGTSCKKAINQGGLSEEDCMLRLKRWLVAGLEDSSWDASRARSHHVSLGGSRLHHFAHGLDLASLDAKAGHQP